jgi:Pyruvate/2-oxoacid:ferredoxin oxidoreductase gamma subunit
MLFSKNAQNALDALTAAKEAHKSEVDVLNSTHSEEIRKRDENLKKYQETIKIIEEKLKEENKKLTLAKKRKVKEIVKEHGEDPEKLAELVKEAFGFEILK